jgi:hypothetical protein
MNQHAAAFTPRAMPQQHFPAANYSNNGEQDIQKQLTERFQQFAIDTSRRA